MYYIVVHMIDGTAHTVKFQICTIGGAHIIFQTFVAAIYFIFKCRLTLQFEGGCYIAWQLAFMTQLELTRERFLFIEQLPLLYVDLPLRFRPLGHSAWVLTLRGFAQVSYRSDYPKKVVILFQFLFQKKFC